MKRQIRQGVFETNSSSVHSLTMCSDKEYEKWVNGEVLYWGSRDKFCSKEEIIKELKTMRCYGSEELYFADVNWNDEDEVYNAFLDEEIKTREEFFDNELYETFEQSYVTPNGEKVIAFGYYGHD